MLFSSTKFFIVFLMPISKFVVDFHPILFIHELSNFFLGVPSGLVWSQIISPLKPIIYICLKYFPGPRSIYGFLPCIIPLVLLFFESTDSRVISQKKSLLSFKIQFLKRNEFLNILILFIMYLRRSLYILYLYLLVI